MVDRNPPAKQAMIHFLKWILLFVAFGAGIYFSFFRSSNMPPPVTLKALSLPFLNSNSPQKFSIQEAQEPILIVHLWASWCPPCREEFPSLIQASQKLPSSIRILAISVDDQAEEARLFATAFGDLGHLSVLWDSEKSLSNSLGVSKLPETFIFGPDRRLIRRIGGLMNWTDPRNLQFLLSLPGNSH